MIENGENGPRLGPKMNGNRFEELAYESLTMAKDIALACLDKNVPSEFARYENVPQKLVEIATEARQWTKAKDDFFLQSEEIPKEATLNINLSGTVH